MQRLAYIVCLLRPDFVDAHPCGKNVRGLAFFHELKNIIVSEAWVGSPALLSCDTATQEAKPRETYKIEVEEEVKRRPRCPAPSGIHFGPLINIVKFLER